VVGEACRTISELHILEEVSLEANIRELAPGVHDAKIEMTKVQFELNLKIIDLELKPQPSTPLEAREKCEVVVKDVVVVVDAIMVDYTTLFE